MSSKPAPPKVVPPVANVTVTVWFVGGRTWSYTCPATEAQNFTYYAAAGEATDGDPAYGTHGGIFQPPSAPGRYIVWANVTDFQIS